MLGGGFVIPRNLGEAGDGSDTSTLATTFACQMNKDSIVPGDGVLVMAAAPSVPSTGATPGYPTSCADSAGNTYTLFDSHKFEAATPAVNDGLGIGFFYCSSSVGTINVGGTERVTVTWSNQCYDRWVKVWRILHDGGAMQPLLLAATADNDTTVKAGSFIAVPVPAWTPPRDNALVLGLAVFTGGNPAYGNYDAYTGFYETTSVAWSSARTNQRVHQQTSGANVYLITDPTKPNTEVDLGRLTATAQTGFNGLGQNYSISATWKGGILLAIR